MRHSDWRIPVKQSVLIPVERIEKAIYLIRGEKVMLDRDLAHLYEVSTKVLKQAVKRNIDRFPDDFMFVLNPVEFQDWRSQFVISKADRIGLRYPPMAFTEHGILMLSSVLNSQRAIQVNIEIMRAFVKLRQMLASNAELSRRLDERGSSPTVREGLVNSKWSSTRSVSSLSPAPPVRKQVGFRSRSPKPGAVATGVSCFLPTAFCLLLFRRATLGTRYPF